MPAMQAGRSGPCSACGHRIEQGEVIDFTMAEGPRHMACSDKPGSYRTNRYVTECRLCGAELAKGRARITNYETQVDGVYQQHWFAVCVDAMTCNGRIEIQKAGKA